MMTSNIVLSSFLSLCFYSLLTIGSLCLTFGQSAVCLTVSVSLSTSLWLLYFVSACLCVYSFSVSLSLSLYVSHILFKSFLFPLSSFPFPLSPPFLALSVTPTTVSHAIVSSILLFNLPLNCFWYLCFALRYCGSGPPPVMMSTTNRMSVVFITDSSVAYEGFTASYVAVNASTCKCWVQDTLNINCLVLLQLRF